MSKQAKSIYVTQPTLAPLDDFKSILEGVWDRGILTHNGPLVQQLEKELVAKLDCNNFSLVANGTLALQIAIKALDIKGEIIVPSFTWVATISAIKWEGCTPVFCDIESDTLNIDPNKIESLINKNTAAIMPVHVFGNSCDVDAIDEIAKRNNLKVIYDGAHAIGTKINGKSVFNYGDITATSLHATKLFNTGEGGGCITTDNVLAERMNRIRFFGHDSNKDIVEDGFNGKMTEVHAALGLANLTLFDSVLLDRKEKYEYYLNALSDVKALSFQKNFKNSMNYSYFPVIFESEILLLKTMDNLAHSGIFPRRYFYPSVNTFTNIVDYSPTPTSEDISSRIICLPLYYNLTLDEMRRIIDIVKESCK